MDIFKAVEDGDLALVKKLIAGGVDVNEVNDNDDQQTPLHLATKKSGIEVMLPELMEAKRNNTKLDREYVDNKINTARENNLLIVKALLDAGAKVNVKDRGERTPLSNAGIHGAPREVHQLLIENGADVKVLTSSGATLLHDAVSSDDPELVQLYLDNGLHVNVTDKFDRTPLHEAAKNSRNPEVIKLLLKNGAKKEVKDNINLTPLHESSRYNIPEISKALVEAGADLNATFNDNRKTPIHVAAWNSKSPVELISLFLEHGANINARDALNNTPLHYIYEFKKTDITQDLIDLGADVKAVNNQGDTPLHILAQKSKGLSEDIVRSATLALLKNGAEIDAPNSEKKTPAEISPIIKELIEEYSSYIKEGEILQEITAKDKDLDDKNMKVVETVMLHHYDTPQKFDAMKNPSNKEKKQDKEPQSSKKIKMLIQRKKNTPKP